jgi:hypothetical protein
MNMKRSLVAALAAAGLASAALAQETSAPRTKLTPAEQHQLDIDNQGRSTPLTAEQQLARMRGGSAAQRKGYEPTPPPADPRDFTGLWAAGGGINLTQADGGAPPFTPAEAKETQSLIDAENSGKVITDAPSQCFPHGVPRLGFAPYPVRFTYLPGEILMLHEVNHNLRIIHMDQKETPKDIKPGFLGYSVGHWDGNTLVINTDHFNDQTLLDFHTQHGTRLKVTEHITKEKTPQGFTDLVVLTTIDDPDHFTKPFTVMRHWPFRSDLANTVGLSDGITEYSCEENNRNVTVTDGHVTIK